tara:strand:- start:309 stop:437 length:129 start_codon:yes stop_codon:yes gene_type:complete
MWLPDDLIPVSRAGTKSATIGGVWWSLTTGALGEWPAGPVRN